MRSITFISALLAFVVLLASMACSRPQPLLPTPTPSPLPPTAAPSPTVTMPPAPTRPGKLQFIGEIKLRALPGVGHNPQAVAVLDGRIYIANRSTNNVSVIEGDEVVAVIAVGAAPIAVAADAETGLVYVANEGEDSISIISGYRVVETVPAPRSPACLAALEGRLYAGGRGENALMVLDGVSGEFIASVPLDASIGVLALAVNSLNDLLYASVYDAVEIVDLKELVVVGRLEREAYLTLGADPSSGRFFVGEYESESSSHYLVAYDALGAQVLGRVLIGRDPRGMAVDANSGRIYVANSWSNDVSIIDGRAWELVATVPVGLRPLDVAVGDRGEVYVVNSGSDNVALVDGRSSHLLHVVPLALLPRGMAVDLSTGRLYVANASTNSIFVVEAGQVVAEIAAGLHPSEVALSSRGDTLSVLNYVGGDLMLISTLDHRVAETVEVGRLPQGLAVVPDGGQLYVSDAVLDADGQRLLRNIELTTIYGTKEKPVKVQVDPRTGRAYMVAFNGVPGSNGGFIVYVLDLETGEPVRGQVGGLSMTGLVLDPEGGRIYSTAGRFGYFQLIVNDAHNLARVATLGLPKYPAALAYNPATHHIFIYLTHTANPSVEPGVELWVLDSRGLGTVGRFPVSAQVPPYEAESYRFAVDSQRGYVYLADAWRGTVHVMSDVPLPPPPSPIPTYTLTPWPTLTPHPEPTPTVASAVEPSCERAAAPLFERYWSDLGLGCPTDDMQVGPTAEQAFERGYMVWRASDRAIFVFYNDGVWRSYPDQWNEGLLEFSCEVVPPGGLQQPKRGFGWVWCAEKGVKEGLGWATENERGYAGQWQFFERGQMMDSGTRPVIYALFDDGTYREYSTQ